MSFVFRSVPEDFEVEELAAFERSGTGAHLHVEIEKRGISTVEAARRLARALGADPRAVGFAGRKDAQAVARQWLSIEGGEPRRALGLELAGLRVLRAERHERKLRVGALRGNRFRLRLRAVVAADRPAIAAALERLARDGLPNAFGPQRFGFGGRAPELGRLLVERRWRDYLLRLCTPEHWPATPALAELRARLERGGRADLRTLARLAPALSPELAPLARQLARRRDDWRGGVRALSRDLTRMHVSALQSRVFNRVLAERRETFGALEPGDIAHRHPPPSPFEESPTGPIPGWKAPLAEGRPGQIERAALAAEGLENAALRGIGLGLDRRGARRPLRVPLGGLEHQREGDELRLRFDLPAGSYATAVIEELLHSIGAARR